MKNFLKILILPVVVVTILGFTPRVFAADPLTVIFENAPLPLFGVVNFLPGDSESGDATVTNNTDTVQNVYAESVNGSDPDELGSQLYLKVFENGNPIPVYQDEFDDFLSAGPVSLSSLGAGATKIYTFEVSFINSTDNDYQDKTLGFDLCLGFSGGTFQCGDTVISPPSNPGGSSTSIPGGGGGGSGQFVQLIILNESVLSINTADGTATVEWDTNLLATSQVIYGPVPPGGYVLNTSILPNLGYPLGTPENGTKVLHHSVTLFGLEAGQTYVYRVVSRASPPTVGREHTFTMPAAAGTGSFGVIASAASPAVGGGSPEVTQEPFLLNTESTSTEETNAGDNSNLLAFALGGLGFPNFVYVGVILLILLALLWLVWFVSKQRKKNR